MIQPTTLVAASGFAVAAMEGAASASSTGLIRDIVGTGSAGLVILVVWIFLQHQKDQRTEDRALHRELVDKSAATADSVQGAVDKLDLRIESNTRELARLTSTISAAQATEGEKATENARMFDQVFRERTQLSREAQELRDRVRELESGGSD